MVRAALIAAWLALAIPVPAFAAPYVATPAPFQDAPRFSVRYQGHGIYRTRFHATPPNPGEHSDTNDARDSSTQRWSLAFPPGVTIPACAPGPEDPCGRVGPLAGPRGMTRATARIDHRHVDGIYRELDRIVRCRIRRTAKERLVASIRLRYDPTRDAFAVGADNPLVTVLTEFPSACPRQGDSIDRIADTYATPGFSFAPGYGPDRWFTSPTIAISSEVFHGSSVIRVPLADTRRGRPPRHCAVEHRSYERCSTGGSWRGVLTFRRR